MRHAKIYFTLVKDSELEQAKIALDNAVGHFRHIIATHSKLRYMPSLTFFYDETLLQAERLNHLLKKVRKYESTE